MINFFIILYIFFNLGFFIFVKKKYKLFGYNNYDILLPINVLLFFSALSIPYMFYINSNPEVIYTKVDIKNIDILLVKYMTIHVFCILFFSIGTISLWNKVFTHLVNNLDTVKIYNTNKILVILSILFYMLFMINLSSINFDNILLIFINRNETISKLGYLYFVQQVLGYYILFIYLSMNKLSFTHKIGITFFFIAFILASLVAGGRTQILTILMFGFIVLNAKKEFTLKKIIKPKYLITLFFFIGIMYLLPKFRGNAAINNDKITTIITSKDEESYQFYQIFSDISGLDRYLFVIDIFDKNEYWLGAGYLDVVKILVHPIVNSDKKNLPKGDDGLYIAVMSNENRFFNKTFRVGDEYTTSYPVGNYAAYMNFGVIGVLLSYFLLGGIANTLYTGCKKGRFKYIYFYTLFISGTISFSNLSILNLVINVLTMLIVFGLIFVFNQNNIKLVKQ